MTDALGLQHSVAIFGDPEGTIWGVLTGGSQPRLVLRPLEPEGVPAESAPVSCERAQDGGFSACGDGIELRLELVEASATGVDDGPWLQPLRLSGSGVIDGCRRELDLAGAIADLGLGRTDGGARMFGSWFPEGREFGLAAIRPQGARGHDHDRISVVARGEDAAAVFDPRLSTTYASDGAPRQAGLELWLGAEEEAEHHPRRIAAVATGARLHERADGADLRAHALSCVSRGTAGVGVYALLQATA